MYIKIVGDDDLLDTHQWKFLENDKYKHASYRDYECVMCKNMISILREHGFPVKIVYNMEVPNKIHNCKREIMKRACL